MTALLDTNIIIWHLTGEPTHQATAATATLATTDELIVTEVTLAECAHVLRAVYRTPDTVIAAVLRSLIAQPNITVEHPERATTTLELLETSGLGYADANLAATALTMGVAVCSFDRGLDRITGLQRNEPG